jgi:excisionase family DNA binding protein
MDLLSTAEMATRVGVHKRTLLAWLYAKKIREPKSQIFAGQKLRLWSKRDLIAVRNYKAANYRKGRGRKKAAAK